MKYVDVLLQFVQAENILFNDGLNVYNIYDDCFETVSANLMRYTRLGDPKIVADYWERAR